MANVTQADTSLLSFIQIAEEDGLATRSWLMAGRLLAVCQGCEKFSGSDCTDFPGDSFRKMLINVQTVCPSWWSRHNQE